MPSQFPKVSSGAPVGTVLGAAYHNAIRDALKWVDLQRNSTGAGFSGKNLSDTGVVSVINKSGTDVPVGGILGIGDADPTPTDSLDYFKFSTRITGVAPVAATHKNKFVVAIKPVPTADGNTVALMGAVGIFPAKVYITATTDQYCDVIDGNSGTFLGSGGSGAQILWREGGAAGVTEWAIIRVAGGAGLAIVPFELKTDLVAGSTATAYLMLADCSNSNLDAPTFTVYDEPEGGRSGKGRDSITIITGEHGARGHAIYDTDSGHWQILSIGLSSDDIEVSVVTNVDFDIATGAWRKKTRTLTGAFGAESSWTPYESGLAAGSDYQRDAVTVTTTTSGGTTFGTNCTLTATITHATGTGDPTGYVIFRVDGKEQVDNGGPYYTARPVSAGVATATVYLAGGDHVITAEYGGDASYNGGTSEDCSISVAKASTTLALVVVPNSVTYGDEITMTATLTPSVSTSPTIYPSPTGMIVFRRGGVPIQTVTLSSNAAHYTTRTLAAGTGALTAEYRGVIGDLTEAAVGDDNYDTSTSSSTALTIAKKQLTCTAANATKVYGDANPAFSCTWTGLVLSETLSYAVHGSPTISSTATTTSAVGTYPITPVIGTCTADNYLLTGCFVAGTLTVSLAPLVVTANPASMVYGDAIPTFGGTIATLKGTDASTITFQGTCSASSTSPPNTYTISANVVDSGSVLSNYSVTKIDSTLTVAKAPLTVTADWKTMAKDASLPALTGTIDGLKNSDSIAFLGNTTADGHTSGMFKINATVTDSGSKLPRYNVSYVSAYLYVN